MSSPEVELIAGGTINEKNSEAKFVFDGFGASGYDEKNKSLGFESGSGAFDFKFSGTWAYIGTDIFPELAITGSLNPNFDKDQYVAFSYILYPLQFGYYKPDWDKLYNKPDSNIFITFSANDSNCTFDIEFKKQRVFYKLKLYSARRPEPGTTTVLRETTVSWILDDTNF